MTLEIDASNIGRAGQHNREMELWISWPGAAACNPDFIPNSPERFYGARHVGRPNQNVQIGEYSSADYVLL